MLKAYKHLLYSIQRQNHSKLYSISSIKISKNDSDLNKESKFQEDESSQKQQEESPPPNPFMLITAMGLGAVMAVGIAAIGVYSSFHMGVWVVANTASNYKIDKKEDNELVKNN